MLQNGVDCISLDYIQSILLDGNNYGWKWSDLKAQGFLLSTVYSRVYHAAEALQDALSAVHWYG